MAPLSLRTPNFPLVDPCVDDVLDASDNLQCLVVSPYALLLGSVVSTDGQRMARPFFGVTVKFKLVN